MANALKSYTLKHWIYINSRQRIIPFIIQVKLMEKELVVIRFLLYFFLVQEWTILVALNVQSCHKFRCRFLIFWIHYLESGRYFYIKVTSSNFIHVLQFCQSASHFNWHQMSGKAAKRDLFQCRLLSLSMKSHKNYVGTCFYPNLIY